MQTIFIWWPGCRDKCGRPKGPDLHGSLHCRFLTKHSLNQWEKYLIICGMYFWKQTWRVFVVFSGVQRSTFCVQWLLLLPGPPKPRSVAGNVHVSNLGPNTTESNMARNRVGPALVSWSVKISFVVANFHPCFQILLLRMASWSLKWWSRYKIQDKLAKEYIIVLYPSRTTGVTTWTWRKTPGEGFPTQFDRFFSFIKWTLNPSHLQEKQLSALMFQVSESFSNHHQRWTKVNRMK